jgi:serine protease Do
MHPRERWGSVAAIAISLVAAAGVGCGKGKALLGGDDGGHAGTNGEIPPAATSVVPLTPPEPPSATAREPGPKVESAPLSFASIARHADPSVVTITTVGEEVEVSPFSHRPRRRELQGLGTGFIVDKDGLILTNNHVIDEANQVTVKLSDDRQFDAKLVGKDKSTDLAVLRIDAKGLPVLPLGDSDGMEVGDWVVAIGNPFGLAHTVSAGIVSAKGRSREDVPLDPTGYYDFLQTDASINPGNSGGPLLNLKGEVVGINTAIRGGGAQGIGFAIPINMVKQLLPMLLRDGHITRSALGITIHDVHELSPEDRQALKLLDEKGTPLVQNGAVIESVSPGGAADKAGLRPGDVILAFEGHDIERSAQLVWLASTHGVGKKATVRVARDGKRMDIPVVLGQLAEVQPARRRTPHGLPPGLLPQVP